QIIRNQPLRSEAPSCGWHTIAAVPPAQYGLPSSSQNAMNRARHTEAHSRMAKSSGKPSVAGTSGRLQLNRGETPRSDTLLQLNMRMALAHGIVQSTGIALETRFGIPELTGRCTAQLLTNWLPIGSFHCNQQKRAGWKKYADNARKCSPLGSNPRFHVGLSSWSLVQQADATTHRSTFVLQAWVPPSAFLQPGAHSLTA